MTAQRINSVRQVCAVYVAVLNEPMNFPLVREWEIARGKEKSL